MVNFRWKSRLIWGVVLLAFTLLVPLGCAGGPDQPPPTQPSVELKDAFGRTITAVDEETRSTILSTITGLPPNKPFELMLYKDTSWWSRSCLRIRDNGR